MSAPRKISAYNQFVSQYFREHKGQGSASELMSQAAAAWREHRPVISYAMRSKGRSKGSACSPLGRLDCERHKACAWQMGGTYTIKKGKHKGQSRSRSPGCMRKGGFYKGYSKKQVDKLKSLEDARDARLAQMYLEGRQAGDIRAYTR